MTDINDKPLESGVRSIAEGVREGRLSARALASEAVAKAREHENLNIFTALAPSIDTRSDGVLAGVPFAAKDSIDAADFPTRAASPALDGYRHVRNATVVDKLVAAGASLIGKANMHELSFGITSNNAAYGPVRNPYHPDHVAGGSSGGSAVAVAVGAVAFALAADTGGSSRIPAAFCGQVGFRPSTGRWPDDGLVKVAPTRDTAGVIARFVDDIILVDQVIMGEKARPAEDLANLTFGVFETPFLVESDPAVERVIRQAIEIIKSSGAKIVSLDATALEALDQASGFPIAFHEARIELTDVAKTLGTDLAALASRIASPDVRGIIQSLVDSPPDEDGYREALAKRAELQGEYDRLLDGVDAFLMPCTPVTAPPVGEDDVIRLHGADVPLFPTVTRFTGPASVVGAPSISIPAGLSKAGLPVGLMIETGRGADLRLLQIARAVEAVL